MSESTTTNTTTSTTNTPAKGNWTETKSKLKAQFPDLTDADLQYEQGKKDEMFERVQVKIGKTKEEMAALLTSL